MSTIPDLTNLSEWNEFAANHKTVLEVLTILNNRHREAISHLQSQLDKALENYAREKQALKNAAQDCFKLIRENNELRQERDAAQAQIKAARSDPALDQLDHLTSPSP